MFYKPFNAQSVFERLVEESIELKKSEKLFSLAAAKLPQTLKNKLENFITSNKAILTYDDVTLITLLPHILADQSCQPVLSREEIKSLNTK